MRRVLLAVVLVTLHTSPALGGSGVEDWNAQFNDHTVTVWIDYATRENGTSVETAVRSGQPLPLIIYKWIPESTPESIGLEHLCNASGGPLVAPDPPWGWWYRLEGFDRTTGALVSREAECLALPDPNAPPSVPPAPPLPTPPTIGEVWNAVVLPAPQMQTSPIDRGVTGLETWFWVQSDTERHVAVSIDGYTVTGTARVVDYEVDTGDGAPVRAASPGTEHDPAVHHTYDTKGTYQVSVATRWRAEATMTAPGIATPITIDLGTAAIRTTRDYQVVEIRSQLTG